MPLANTLEMVRAARQGGYAVPAINIVDDLSLRTVIAAAQQAGSPLIVQTSVKTVKSMGADILSYIAHIQQPGRSTSRSRCTSTTVLTGR